MNNKLLSITFYVGVCIYIFSCDTYATATTTYTGYLNLFDLVQVEKRADQSQGHWHVDWFEGRLIP